MRPHPRLLISTLLTLCLLGWNSLLGSVAWAGPNAGGVLIFHYNPDLNPSCDLEGPFCGQSSLTACENAITRYDTGGSGIHCPTLFVLAAFPANSHPRMSGVEFGLDYNAASITISQSKSCANFELTTDGWPAPQTGVALTFVTPQQSLLAELYEFVGYNYDGAPGTLRLTPHPIQGGWFGDDSVPSHLDAIQAYGAMGFDTDGTLPCPPPLPPSGACCFPDGHCEILLEIECTGPGQTFQGEDTLCSPNPCAALPGACCFGDGTCQVLLRAQCLSGGGNFMGYGTECSPSVCPPAAACCFADGSCQHLTQQSCASHGGTFHGSTPTCDPNPCPQPGACCYSDGHCIVQQNTNCINGGGVPMGGGVPCDPNPCLDLPGACCIAGSGCLVMDRPSCDTQGGIWRGYGTNCNGVQCPVAGACCLLDGSCFIAYIGACQANGGSYQGDLTDCSPNPCPPPGACCFVDGGCAAVPAWSCLQQGGTFAGEGTVCDPNPCPQPCGSQAIIHRENAPTPLPRLASWPGGATAGADGPNHNGTLILHTNPSLVYTSDQGSYCGQTGLPSCGSAVARKDSSDPAVIFAIAAFPLHSHPRLAGITFGLTYGNCVVLDSWGPCADFELATSGWPAPGEGTALTWNAAQTTLLKDVYWFGAYVYEGKVDQMTLTPHPTQGGYFADDSLPSVLDPIADFGSFGFNRAGDVPCPLPAPATGGCCLLTGECVLTTFGDCSTQGGSYFGDDTLCDAQPCVPRGACCINLACYIRTSDACTAENGVYQGDGVHCSPELCGGGGGGCGGGVASGVSHGEAKSTGLGRGIRIDTGAGAGTGCGTLNLNSDGTYENAFAWSYAGVVPPTYGAFAECFATAGNQSICSAIFDLTQIGNQAGQQMDVYVWDDGGGCPGNVICGPSRVTPGTIAFWPALSRHVVDLTGCCDDGAFWVGYWGNWPGETPGWYIGADLDGFGGCPSTNIAPGIGFPSGWQNVSAVWGPTQALGIGCELAACGPVATQRMSWGKVKTLYQGDEGRRASGQSPR